MTLASDERAALSDLFDALGPDAPTLLGAWTTGDLLAHLLVRERRPDAAAGIFLPMFAARTERAMAAIRRATAYTGMVEKLRTGPPMWSPFAIPVVGDRANTIEFYVHHEDVRRAQEGWQPRGEDRRREDALWQMLQVLGRMLYRKSPVGVVLQSAGRTDMRVHRGARSVNVVGLPSEILLHAYGRPNDVVRVVIQGAPADVAALTASARGM